MLKYNIKMKLNIYFVKHNYLLFINFKKWRLFSAYAGHQQAKIFIKNLNARVYNVLFANVMGSQLQSYSSL